MIFNVFYVFGISLLADGSYCTSNIVTKAFQKPRVDAHLVSIHTLQIHCDYRFAETVESKVYRIDMNISASPKHILKVTNGDKGCKVSTDLPSESVQCICLKGSGVVCNISDISIANRNGQWTCAVIEKTKWVLSDVANVSQDLLETFTATAVTTSTSKEELIRDITINNSNVSMGHSPSSPPPECFLLLAATLLICVFRKFQIRTEAISPPLADNVSSVRTTTHELLFEGVTARQRSPSHHYEQIPMMEISPLADRYPLSNEGIIAEHIIEAEAEHVNVNHYYTITDSQDTDVPVYQNENLESEPHWSETVRYETLLPKRPDEKTPYSSLANI